jgi:hypothetical protein
MKRSSTASPGCVGRLINVWIQVWPRSCANTATTWLTYVTSPRAPRIQRSSIGPRARIGCCSRKTRTSAIWSSGKRGQCLALSSFGSTRRGVREKARDCWPPLIDSRIRYSVATQSLKTPDSAYVRSSHREFVESATLGANSVFWSGAPEEIRTPDPQIRSLVLYPAELRALWLRVTRQRRIAIGSFSPWQGIGASGSSLGARRAPRRGAQSLRRGPSGSPASSLPGSQPSLDRAPRPHALARSLRRA